MHSLHIARHKKSKRNLCQIQHFLMRKKLQNDDAVWSKKCEKILQINAFLTRFLAIFLPFNVPPTKNTSVFGAFYVDFFVKKRVNKCK